MKKIIALVLASLMLVMTLSLASCANNKKPTATDSPKTNPATTPTTSVKTDVPETPAYKDALELYNKIWASFTDDDKFPVGGGDPEHTSMEGPGLFDIEKNKDSFVSYTHITDDLIAMVENDAASLMHMMNINTFSSAVVRLKDASKAETFAEEYKKAVQATHWMCGFPDTMIVVSIGDYVVIAFGNEKIIETLKTKALAVDSAAKLLVEAPAMA